MKNSPDLNFAKIQTLDSHLQALSVENCSHYRSLQKDLDYCLSLAKKENLPEIHVSANEGKFLAFLVKTLKARKILELGTLSGYSTLWLASGVEEQSSKAHSPSDAKIITLEYDPLHAKVANQVFEQSRFSPMMELRVGAALDLLPRLVEQYPQSMDLVFIDADKINYPKYVEYAISLTRKGGMIVCDNMIREDSLLYKENYSEVLAGQKGKEETVTQHIDSLLHTLHSHPSLFTCVFPIIRERVDGVSLSIVL